MTESFYLPMDCPACGRQRLLVYPDEQRMKCEKCGAMEFYCDEVEHAKGGPHPQWPVRQEEGKE